ncbi:MAG: phasin family protein [Terasakiella sp.]|uniref:phasin family protein n=1 Tax=unclassified Terasakiella TaxID=2614952 RepID=UPI003B00223F
MTSTDKKAPTPATKSTATARRAPARKAAAAKKANAPVKAEAVVETTPKAAVAVEAKTEVKTQTVTAVPAKATSTVKETSATEEKPVLEAKLELLSTQIQEGYNEMFEFSKEQMEKFFKVEGVDTFKAVEDAMAFSKSNVDAFVKSSSIAAKGVQDVASLFAEMARTSIEENMAASKKVFECKTPQEVAELQAELLKSGYDKMMANATRISEASTKIAEEASKPLQERVEASVEKLNVTTAA